MGNELDVVGNNMSQEMAALVKDSIAKGATDLELSLFIHQCNRTQLDPFAKQIYLVGRWDKTLGREVQTAQVSIDGMRLVAQRSHGYAGQEEVLWCASDGQWMDVWLSKDPPAAAKAGVLRDGFENPLRATATWDQYAVYIKPKNGERYLSPFWSKMPALMLGKCAEALALRKAFPMELSGLYIAEEMGEEDERPARKSRKQATPQPTTTSENGTRTRSAPVVTEPDEEPEIMASDDMLNGLEETLHGLSDDDKTKVGEAWKKAGIRPLGPQMSENDVERVQALIGEVLTPKPERQYNFAEESERF